MTRKTKKTEKKKTAKAVPQSGMSRASAASSKTKVATKAPRRGTEPAAAPRHDPAGAGSPVKGPGRSRAARKAAAVNASAVRQADPFYARELAQYEHPLPSREYVLQVLAERGVPLSFADLVAALDVAPHELDFFDRRLRAMERDGQIIRNRRDAYLLEAELQQRDGHNAAEVEVLTRGLAAWPDDSALLYARALAWERGDDIPRAEADLRKILVAEPENVAKAVKQMGLSHVVITDRKSVV